MEEKTVALEGSDPDVVKLANRFEDSIGDLSGWIEQVQDNYDTRHCYWAGQTLDQRKHSGTKSKAFPWEGASDLRTFTVDEIVRYYNGLLVNAFFRADVLAMPVEVNDQKKARMVSIFMRWLIYSQMTELRREVSMLANFINERGVGAMGVFWEDEVVKERIPLTLEQLAQVDETMVEAIQDKRNATRVADVLEKFFPELSRRKVMKMVTELRNTGQTTVAVPGKVKSRPVVKAFDLSEDLIIPINTTDIQDAPWIFKVDWLSQTELEAKILEDDWDEAWVKRLLEKGPSQTRRSELIYKHDTHSWERTYGVDQVKDLYEVVCAYYKETDEDGIPTVYYTIFNPEMTTDDGGKPIFAKHGEVDYKPARYPFVVFSREILSRQLMESRGIPQVAKGWQSEIKFQRDSRIDRATLATVPPREHPIGRKLKEWGPGVDIPVRKRGEYGYVEIPQPDSGSNEVEATIESTMRRYFGLETETGSGDEARQIRQDAVNLFLDRMREVFRSVWSLYQQYGPQEQYFKVVGVVEPQHFEKGNDELTDVYIDFNVLNDESEAKKEEIQAIGDILSRYDRQAQANWSEYLRFALGSYSPTVVDKLLVPVEDATEKETEETKSDLTKIWSGMDIDLQPGVNVGLRKQIVEQYLQGSENIPATDVQQRMQTDEAFAKRIQKYQDTLDFYEKQYQENPQIGRQGTPPGNM